MTDESAISLVEVGPRDGLQNEPGIVPTSVKIAFIEALVDSGVRTIEATSFVNPNAVPQLADAEVVMTKVMRRPLARYMALVPNERGFDRALATGVDAIALFTSATEAFCQANIRCSIDESFERFAPVLARASELGVWVRGYVSVAFDCPYSGKVDSEAAVTIAERLFSAGCVEVSIADTIGTAVPTDVDRFLDIAESRLPMSQVAMHFHDTSGQAIDNVARAYERGIRIFDASAGGLGGCPFAPGAPGNVATESVLLWCEENQIPTTVDRLAVERAVHELRASLALA